MEEDAQRLGCQIILPSSIPGTPRYMKQLYQDAMAICRHYGRPDFFITFTYNPKWDEITSNIPAGSSATDRPDIVSRVFSLKLKTLVNELLKKHVLGKTVADIYVVEFQKRGLPHAHILLIMDHDDKIRDVEGIDNIICAEIPDRNIDPNLYDIVTSNMMHGPCGPTHSDSPCMKKITAAGRTSPRRQGSHGPASRHPGNRKRRIGERRASSPGTLDEHAFVVKPGGTHLGSQNG